MICEEKLSKNEEEKKYQIMNEKKKSELITKNEKQFFCS